MRRRTDAQVLAEVRAALAAAPVDELAIESTMADGVVRLRGELGSHSERLAAMTAAKYAAAPARVTSELTVAPAGRDYRLTDADISLEVARALVQSDVPPGAVWFDVANRVVTLRGTARDAAERAHIRHVVQAAPGVHFIDNRIVAGTSAPAR